MSETINFLDFGSKDEDIFGANFLIDLDVGSIHGAEDESSVHDKFHVAGS